MDAISSPLLEDDLTPAEAQIQARYPGVPYPLYYSWERSDRDMPRDLEQIASLGNTVAALELAAKACKTLLSKQEPMTPEMLNEILGRMTEAAFRVEDQLGDLRLKYPMPVKRHRNRVVSSPQLRHFTPKMLSCTDAQFLIWTPMLPAIGAEKNSIIFTTLFDLLLTAELPTISQWHCDFFHVFRPEQMIGARDVDNYPYKPVIDAIARAMFTRDCAEHFSCSMYNLCSENLTPGCYIRVTKRAEKVPFFTEFESSVLALE